MGECATQTRFDEAMGVWRVYSSGGRRFDGTVREESDGRWSASDVPMRRFATQDEAVDACAVRAAWRREMALGIRAEVQGVA